MVSTSFAGVAKATSWVTWEVVLTEFERDLKPGRTRSEFARDRGCEVFVDGFEGMVTVFEAAHQRRMLERKVHPLIGSASAVGPITCRSISYS